MRCAVRRDDHDSSTSAHADGTADELRAERERAVQVHSAAAKWEFPLSAVGRRWRSCAVLCCAVLCDAVRVLQRFHPSLSAKVRQRTVAGFHAITIGHDTPTTRKSTAAADRYRSSQLARRCAVTAAVLAVSANVSHD